MRLSAPLLVPFPLTRSVPTASSPLPKRDAALACIRDFADGSHLNADFTNGASFAAVASPRPAASPAALSLNAYDGNDSPRAFRAEEAHREPDVAAAACSSQRRGTGMDSAEREVTSPGPALPFPAGWRAAASSLAAAEGSGPHDQPPQLFVQPSGSGSAAGAGFHAAEPAVAECAAVAHPPPPPAPFAPLVPPPGAGGRPSAAADTPAAAAAAAARGAAAAAAAIAAAGGSSRSKQAKPSSRRPTGTMAAVPEPFLPLVASGQLDGSALARERMRLGAPFWRAVRCAIEDPRAAPLLVRAPGGREPKAAAPP